MLDIYLPIAGVSINVLVLLSLGAIVGLLSGLFGVGGGFLLTPLLMMMGIPPTVAAASDANQIVAASTSGTLAYLKRQSIDLKIGAYMLIGGFAGSTAGVQVIKILRSMGNADFVIKLCYVLMLGAVGVIMLIDGIKIFRKHQAGEDQEESVMDSETSSPGGILKKLPWQMHFQRSNIRMSVLVPLVLGTMVGLLAAIMGVGGGFIMVPAMIYLLRMPVALVVGTSLFQILFTSLNTTFMQALSNGTVDVVLAIILLIGSTVGAQFGSIIGRKLNAQHLKMLMALLVLGVCVKMVFSLLATPDLLLAYKGGH